MSRRPRFEPFVPNPADFPTEDQERRWTQAVANLVDVYVCLPPAQQVGPKRRLGRERAWEIRLADGRMGWARERPIFDGYLVHFYLPADVALRCELTRLVRSGYTREQARAELNRSSTWKPDLFRALLNLHLRDYVELKAEAEAWQTAQSVRD